MVILLPLHAASDTTIILQNNNFFINRIVLKVSAKVVIFSDICKEIAPKSDFLVVSTSYMVHGTSYIVLTRLSPVLIALILL